MGYNGRCSKKVCNGCIEVCNGCTLFWMLGGVGCNIAVRLAQKVLAEYKKDAR